MTARATRYAQGRNTATCATRGDVAGLPLRDRSRPWKSEDHGRLTTGEGEATILTDADRRCQDAKRAFAEVEPGALET